METSGINTRNLTPSALFQYPQPDPFRPLARAKQIATNSRPGVWVQDEAGAWQKK